MYVMGSFKYKRKFSVLFYNNIPMFQVRKRSNNLCDLYLPWLSHCKGTNVLINGSTARSRDNRHTEKPDELGQIRTGYVRFGEICYLHKLQTL